MGIQKHIWTSHLVGNYWKKNAFLKNAVQVDKGMIYGGKFVHISVVNGRPEVVVNATIFPINASLREDKDIYYKIDEHFVKPFRIPNADNYELSYSKRESVVGEQSAAANESAAEHTLFRWQKYAQVNDDGSTSTMLSQIIRTTGSNAAAYLPGATGNRKMLTVADFKAAKVLLNTKDVPFEDRFAAVDSNMLDQLTQDPEYKKAEKIYEAELVEGTVAKIQGFNIYERSSVSRFTNDVTPAIYAPSVLPPEGSSAEDEQHAGALLWQKYGVETAVGDVEFFQNEKQAEYYGDIYSALLRAGGRIRRSDSVISIVQTT